MLPLFAKLTAGHFRRHKLEALLCLVGVALGVAVSVGIDAAVQACVGSFQGAVESLAERSTHGIFAGAGSIPDQTYIDLLNRKLPVPLAPMIDRGTLIARPGETEGGGTGVVARLIGVDVFSERSLRSFTQMQSSLDADTFRDFLTQPGSVVLVDTLADRLGVHPGDDVTLTLGGERKPARVVGIVHPAGVARSQLTDLIVADLATAQELTGSIGQIDRIDTSLETEQQEKDLAAALPKGLELRSTSQQAQSLTDLIASYRLNLSALSLMASYVAVFIVYNSLLISVRQRLQSLGILRCLGASRAHLGGIYGVEAVLFALLGGLLGVLGGWALSGVLVRYIGTTINDLYAAVRPGAVALTASMFAKGFAISIASCFVGALVPLIQAARTPPVNAFRGTAQARGTRKFSTLLLLAGVLLLGVSIAIYFIPGRSPIVGFAMALLIATGFAFTCPALTRLVSAATTAAARPLQWLPLQMAASGVARSLGITGVAIAAMMLAMAMNVGLRTMVGSFREALAKWMERRFAADVFVGPELLVNHKIDATLDPRVLAWVRAQPESRDVIEYRARTVTFAVKPIMLVGTNVGHMLSTLPIKSIERRRPFDPERDVLISEPLAGRTGLGIGSTIDVPGVDGPRPFRVFGVFFDFGSERGQVMMERTAYATLWRDPSINSLHVRTPPGSDPPAIAARWSAALRGDYPVVVNSFTGVKAEVLAVFDRTFRVTDVLTWLAAGVAFCGLAGSLLALALARRRDYSVLRAIGMSGKQTAGWVVAQALLIAWTATFVACVAGTALAYVLAYVIQYRSFGWSIPTGPYPRFWIENLILATVAALLASIYPVIRLRSAPPAGDLRQE